MGQLERLPTLKMHKSAARSGGGIMRGIAELFEQFVRERVYLKNITSKTETFHRQPPEASRRSCLRYKP